jgi:hypothetical protein
MNNEELWGIGIVAELLLSAQSAENLQTGEKF